LGYLNINGRHLRTRKNYKNSRTAPFQQYVNCAFYFLCCNRRFYFYITCNITLYTKHNCISVYLVYYSLFGFDFVFDSTSIDDTVFIIFAYTPANRLCSCLIRFTSLRRVLKSSNIERFRTCL